jgi:hypothetical protein
VRVMTTLYFFGTCSTAQWLTVPAGSLASQFVSFCWSFGASAVNQRSVPYFVDTGGETKLNLNKPGPATKNAQVDRTINNASVGIFSVQICLVLLLGALGSSWSGHGNGAVWYLQWDGSAGPIAGDQWAAFDYDSSLAVPSMLWNGTGVGPRPTSPATFELQRLQLQRDAINAAESPTLHQHDKEQQPEGQSVLTRRLHEARGALVSVIQDSLETGTQSNANALHSQKSTHRLRGGSTTGTTGGAFLWFTALVLPLRFLLLSSMMIPISLRVTLDALKWLYSSQVSAAFDFRYAPIL